VSLSARHRIPAVYPFRYIPSEGGLIAYGVDITDLHRRAASYVDRILKGAHPSDLPVQSPIKFFMSVNIRTARALGLDVPPTLLAIADEATVCCACSRPLLALFCRVNRAEQCRLLGVDRPTYAQCEVFAF
jgi:ABC transporter substrate binding protein